MHCTYVNAIKWLCNIMAASCRMQLAITAAGLEDSKL
jgi:hypothetical protein